MLIKTKSMTSHLSHWLLSKEQKIISVGKNVEKEEYMHNSWERKLVETL